MNLLVIYREEILALILSLMIFSLTRFYNIHKADKHYYRMLIFLLIHIVLDFITVYTINNADTISLLLNRFIHFLFYSTAMMTVVEFGYYIFNICFRKKVADKFYRLSIVFVILYTLSFPVLPFEIVYAKGVYSSSGLGAYIGFGSAVLLMIACLILIIIKRDVINIYVKKMILPNLIIVIVLSFVQVYFKELLFTSGALTIVATSILSMLENPAETIEQNSIGDSLIKIENKESFYKDLKELNLKFVSNKNKSYIFAFINATNLKQINDLYSHKEGDRYINLLASKLTSSLEKANSIYRMNGNEFIAVYENISEDIVVSELKLFESSVNINCVDKPYEVHISIGYAISNNKYDDLYNVVNSAFFIMFNDKLRHNRLNQENDFIKIDEDVTGLTSHLFEILEMDHEGDYIFMCNTNTNVARLSDNWKNKFNLPNQYVSNFLAVLAYYVKEEDRERFTQKLSNVILNDEEKFEITFHAIDKNEEVVKCILKGIYHTGGGSVPKILTAYMRIID